MKLVASQSFRPPHRDVDVNVCSCICQKTLRVANTDSLINTPNMKPFCVVRSRTGVRGRYVLSISDSFVQSSSSLSWFYKIRRRSALGTSSSCFQNASNVFSVAFFTPNCCIWDDDPHFKMVPDWVPAVAPATPRPRNFKGVWPPSTRRWLKRAPWCRV